MISALWQSYAAAWRRLVFGPEQGVALPEIDTSASAPPLADPRRRKYEWPDTSSTDEDKTNGCFILAYSINGTQYKKEEVEPGRWQWVIDQDVEKEKRRYEKRRAELWQALQTRVISDEEMDEVLRFGEYINIPFNRSYNPEKKQRERGNAFVTQERLRAARRSGGELGGQP